MTAATKTTAKGGKTSPAPAAKTTAVAKAANTVIQLPEESFEAFGNQGFDGIGRDDLAIPFYAILQSGSPQCKRSEGAYIEGAQEGDIINTVTNEVIDTSKTDFIVVPAAYVRKFVEWRLRENGGGFAGEHEPDPAMQAECERDDKNRDILPNGNQLNDTRTFYVMAIGEDGVPQPGVISMTSTQIKKSKQWLMQQNMLKLQDGKGRAYTPPMFASKWKVTTVPESNDKGSWFGWKFDHVGYLAGPNDPVFVAAMDFHKSVSTGAVKVDMSKAPDQRVNPETGELEDAPEY